MSDDRSENRGSEPDESIPYVREMEVYDVAEDVKTVRFIGDARTVEIGITDDVMVDFAEVAEDVFDRIHGDMAEMNDLLDDSRRDSVGDGDRS
ncbi:hypothetical protein [Natrinema salaciae]|uniref:Uncharacterized protein n=1 Tax=Natrinema salaciae TaxID=1186196 RepID=A0A1H9CPW8_9EURY|nr:hypothetical protein [Natrinema salaciae]SEQ03245.1 hypothetical protein SAMN04489841_1121 [Natrinema salaciae]